jgi:hypothetical protein
MLNKGKDIVSILIDIVKSKSMGPNDDIVGSLLFVGLV